MTSPQWRDEAEIPGFYYLSEFLSEEEEQKLVEEIDSREFCTAIHRRQQYYGPIYYHTTHDVKEIQPNNNIAPVEFENQYCASFESLSWITERILSLKLPSGHFIFGTDPKNRPNQCLVNEYVRNQGISSHFDDSRAFGDVIVIISLLNPLFMTLKRPRHLRNHCSHILSEKKIWLERRSIMVLSGDARYRWRHGITKAKRLTSPSDCAENSEIYRGENYRRISLTIRKLLDGRKKVEKDTILTETDAPFLKYHYEDCPSDDE